MVLTEVGSAHRVRAARPVTQQTGSLHTISLDHLPFFVQVNWCGESSLQAEHDDGRHAEIATCAWMLQMWQYLHYLAPEFISARPVCCALQSMMSKFDRSPWAGTAMSIWHSPEQMLLDLSHKCTASLAGMASPSAKLTATGRLAAIAVVSAGSAEPAGLMCASLQLLHQAWQSASSITCGRSSWRLAERCLWMALAGLPDMMACINTFCSQAFQVSAAVACRLTAVWDKYAQASDEMLKHMCQQSLCSQSPASTSEAGNSLKPRAGAWPSMTAALLKLIHMQRASPSS